MENENKSISHVEKVYRSLREDINNGNLHPGEKIAINELSQRFNMSATPIKQALNRLVVEGLLENSPRKGMKVKKHSWTDIEEIMNIRMMLDTFFVKDVILSLSSSLKLRRLIEENLQKTESIISSGRELPFELDAEFHELYLTGSGNSKALEIFKSLQHNTYGLYMYHSQSKERAQMCLNEHRNIYNAVLEANEEKAIKCIREHYILGMEVIRITMKVEDLTL